MMKKLAGSKLAQRKFTIPGSGVILAIVNEAAGLGFEFKTMVLVVAGTCVMAAIITWFDIHKLKYDQNGNIRK